MSALDDMDTEAIATADSNRLVFPSSAAYFDAAIPMRRRSADEGRPWFGCLPIPDTPSKCHNMFGSRIPMICTAFRVSV